MPATVTGKKWTDERLGDLNRKVDDGFVDMRAEFRSLRSEMGGLRGEMGGLRGEIAAVQRLMIQLMVGLFGTMILGFAGLIIGHV